MSEWVAHYYGCPMNTKRRERSSPPGESGATIPVRLPSAPPAPAAAVHLSLPATVAGGRSSVWPLGDPSSASPSCVCGSPMGALSPPADFVVVGWMRGVPPPAAWSCGHLLLRGSLLCLWGCHLCLKGCLLCVRGCHHHVCLSEGGGWPPPAHADNEFAPFRGRRETSPSSFGGGGRGHTPSLTEGEFTPIRGKRETSPSSIRGAERGQYPSQARHHHSSNHQGQRQAH